MIRNVGVVEMDYGKAKSVKDIMSEMLAEWLCKDFGILIDEPSEKEIAEALEEQGVDK